MKKICITNRKLVRGDFLFWLEKLLAGVERPDAVVLREKDLPEAEYAALAEKAHVICSRYDTEFVINSFYGVAERMGVKAVHLPYCCFVGGSLELPVLRRKFERIGTSVHKPQEAEQAEKLGADYVFAGHIFATDCKKGLEPRGLEFLRECCRRVSIPVYAIGGIPLAEKDGEDRKRLCAEQGAVGVCIMSDYAKKYATDMGESVVS